jgi:hypothetical protein
MRRTRSSSVQRSAADEVMPNRHARAQGTRIRSCSASTSDHSVACRTIWRQQAAACRSRSSGPGSTLQSRHRRRRMSRPDTRPFPDRPRKRGGIALARRVGSRVMLWATSRARRCTVATIAFADDRASDRTTPLATTRGELEARRGPWHQCPCLSMAASRSADRRRRRVGRAVQRRRSRRLG